MCAIDLEPCDEWHDIRRTAVVAMKCDMCGGIIESGAPYIGNAGNLLDGRVHQAFPEVTRA